MSRPDDKNRRNWQENADPDAPPSEEELRRAARLREALEEGATVGRDPLGDLADAVRLAVAPLALSHAKHKELLDAALKPSPGDHRTPVGGAGSGGNVRYIAFG